MKKTISGIMYGIIATGLLAGCQTEFSKFEYGEMSLPSVMVYKFIIDFDKRVLITQEGPSYSFNPTTKTISLNPEQVSELQKTLNRAGVTGWDDKYVRRGVCDGTFWKASYVLSDGKNRKISGHMDWPYGFEKLSTAIEKLIKSNGEVKKWE